MAARTLSVAGHRMVCHERGTGPTVILLHSGGFSSRQWQKLVDRLSPDHRTIAVDLIGYGASSRWPAGAPFHLRVDVDAIASLLDEQGTGARLVGHSYGGLIALHAALARPTAVHSLSLYEPVAFGILDPLRDADMRATLNLPVAYDGEPWLCKFVDFWNGKGAWDRLAAETREAFLDVGEKVFREVSALIQDETPAETYARIAAPTLLLGGEHTHPSELRVLARLGAALPAATLRLLSDMGHMGPITHSGTINDAIVAHLRSAPT